MVKQFLYLWFILHVHCNIYKQHIQQQRKSSKSKSRETNDWRYWLRLRILAPLIINPTIATDRTSLCTKHFTNDQFSIRLSMAKMWVHKKCKSVRKACMKPCVQSAGVWSEIFASNVGVLQGQVHLPDFFVICEWFRSSMSENKNSKQCTWFWFECINECLWHWSILSECWWA